MSIYMDNGATTRVTEPVFEAMKPYFCEVYGNPSSMHKYGYAARHAVEDARAAVAKAINADPNEIYFTGCGTESDNWAVRGAAYQNVKNGRHIITTTIDHHAIMHTFASSAMGSMVPISLLAVMMVTSVVSGRIAASSCPAVTKPNSSTGR